MLSPLRQAADRREHAGDPACLLGGRGQERQLLPGRDAEGVDLHRRPISVLKGGHGRELDGRPPQARVGPGDLHGLTASPGDLIAVDLVGGRESPGPVGEDTDAKSEGLPVEDQRHNVDLADGRVGHGPDGYSLGLIAVDPYIRVRGSGLGGCFERKRRQQLELVDFEGLGPGSPGGEAQSERGPARGGRAALVQEASPRPMPHGACLESRRVFVRAARCVEPLADGTTLTFPATDSNEPSRRRRIVPDHLPPRALIRAAAVLAEAVAAYSFTTR